MPPSPAQVSLFDVPSPKNGDHEVAPTRAMHLYDRLLDVYGERAWKSWGEPLYVLVSTILSQRTTYDAQRRAYDALWSAYGSWEAIACEEHVEAIEALIEPVTFPEVKAPVIRDTLAGIKARRHEFAIDFLADLPVDEAMAWLMSFRGVGHKTASCVMLFSLRRPVLPVDTHVGRVSQRFGAAPRGASAKKVQQTLAEALPTRVDVLYNYHIHGFRHGQRICTYHNPACDQCPLSDECPSSRA